MKLWRAHIGDFVHYTLGLATHNPAEAATAQKELAGYSRNFAAFVSGATKLPKAAVEADLKGHVVTLSDAIRAIRGKALLCRAAHQHGRRPHGRHCGCARTGHHGLNERERLDNDAGVQAAGRLDEIADPARRRHRLCRPDGDRRQGQPEAPEVLGAIAALGQNTDQLGTAFGSIYGPAAKTRFLQMWRAHIGDFVTYTLGTAAHGPRKVAMAQKGVQGYVSGFSHFVAGATTLPGLRSPPICEPTSRPSRRRSLASSRTRRRPVGSC